VLQEEKADHKKRCSCKTGMSCVTGRKGQWQTKMEMKIKKDIQLQNRAGAEQHWLCESYGHIKTLSLQNQSCYTIERECICCSRGTGYWVGGREPTALTKKKWNNGYRNNRIQKHSQIKPCNWNETILDSFQFYPFHSLSCYELCQIWTHLQPY